MKTSVSLSDHDLATLISSDDVDVRAAAVRAVRRIAAPGRWPSVSSNVATLIADILAEAEKSGRLIFRHESISFCRYCERHSTYQKAKRRKTAHEVKLAGVEFADRFITVHGHISVGACRVCVDEALPILRNELAKLPVELSVPLRLDGAPVYRRWGLVRCKDCEWLGNEGQLGKLRTLMGDGWYPGKCPSCGAEQRFMGRDPFERRDGFEVVKEAA